MPDKTDRIILHATNIHTGGGLTLLNALLSEDFPCPVILLADQRLKLPVGASHKVETKRYRGNLRERFQAERDLGKIVGSNDFVLCFGNLPPLFKLPCATAVFVQNRLLVENGYLEGFSPKIKLRLFVEKIWLKNRAVNADMFIVQSHSMALALRKAISVGEDELVIAPYGAQMETGKPDGVRSHSSPNNPTFIYVASGEPYKNHKCLFAAWELLAAEGIFPNLEVTLNPELFPDLCSQIEPQEQSKQTRIQNLGILSPAQLDKKYEAVDALIYPSKLESFGLPLLEAEAVGLPILASELDYVRDVVAPDYTFDPESPLSIARCVKRFLNIDEKPKPVMPASKFLELVMQKSGAKLSS